MFPRILFPLLFLVSSVLASGQNSFTWNLGTSSDLSPGNGAYFTMPDRAPKSGTDEGNSYRQLKSNVPQCIWALPAFDFDKENYGAINHAFYLTVKFKDEGGKVAFYSGKGGDGLYGKGPIGFIGGKSDGKWKEETLIIPRSMLRSFDGKVFAFSAGGIGYEIKISKMTLFSEAAEELKEKEEIIAKAFENDSNKRAELKRSLSGKFRDLGLPDPGLAPEFTKEEIERGFRAFFPPVNRQLYRNSNAVPGELKTPAEVYACPGQFESIIVAIKGIGAGPGEISLSLPDFAGEKTGINCEIRQAVYDDQRIGSSWDTNYRNVPERLIHVKALNVAGKELGIFYVCFSVPESAAPGEYAGTFIISGRKGALASVPVKLTVYPFKLEAPDRATHGVFYYIDAGEASPFELMDMRNHGIDTLAAGFMPRLANVSLAGSDDGSVKEFLGLAKKFGFKSPLVCNTGNLGVGYKDYNGVIQKTLSLASAAGFKDTAFFPVDEPHTKPKQDKAFKLCTTTKSVSGARTFITLNPNAEKVLEPVLDDYCYNITYINDDVINSTVNSKHELMFYTAGIGTDPTVNRFTAGYYFAKSKARTMFYFAYMLFEGDPYLDWDGGNRDWNVVFPSMDSPFHDPTVEWESLREGVDDYRYIYTLQQSIKKADKAGKKTEAGAADRVLADIMKKVSSNGKKATGPEGVIEGDLRLKGTKLDPELLKRSASQAADAWPDEARRKIAEQIILLNTALQKAQGK